MERKRDLQRLDEDFVGKRAEAPPLHIEAPPLHRMRNVDVVHMLVSYCQIKFYHKFNTTSFIQHNFIQHNFMCRRRDSEAGAARQSLEMCPSFPHLKHGRLLSSTRALVHSAA